MGKVCVAIFLRYVDHIWSILIDLFMLRGGKSTQYCNQCLSKFWWFFFPGFQNPSHLCRYNCLNKFSSLFSKIHHIFAVMIAFLALVCHQCAFLVSDFVNLNLSSIASMVHQIFVTTILIMKQPFLLNNKKPMFPDGLWFKINASL